MQDRKEISDSEEEERHLKVVPEDEGENIDHRHGGGSGPPPRSDRLGWLQIVLVLGLITAAAGAYFLNADPNSLDYYDCDLSNCLALSRIRVYLEMGLFGIGSASAVTAGVFLRRHWLLRAEERKSAGRVKSIKARRLEHEADKGVFETIGSVVGEFFNRLLNMFK